MAKAQSKTSTDDVVDKTKVSLIRLVKGEGAYGYVVYEIAESVLKEHANQVEKSEPDVYAIFVNNLIGVTRRIFGF
jgi:hypothetical protein